MTPLPVAVNHAVAVGHGGALYVLGGYTAFPISLGIPTGGLADATPDFWRYDPVTNRWSSMPPMPTPRAAFAAAIVGHTLYVAGGVIALLPTASMIEFDFSTGRWQAGPPMPIAAEHVAGAALDGRFYALAGRVAYGLPNDNSTQRFDPTTDTWRLMARMRRGHAGFAAVTVCGHIVAFGGEQPGDGLTGTIRQTESYDPNSDRWTLLPDLSVPRHGLGGAAVANHVFAIEGGNITFKSTTDVVEELTVTCRTHHRRTHHRHSKARHRSASSTRPPPRPATATP